MGTFRNRVLRVNLSDRTFAETPLSDHLIRDFVGGRGFGIKWLYDDLKPGIDPLGAENELIFVTGPLSATSAQAFPRFNVAFKSPLTGGCFWSSCGGYIATELQCAGFDAVIVTGASDRPVYLWIHDGQFELRDASFYWGLNCDDTASLLREELHDPGVRVASVGPAGELLVKYAAVMSDRRAMGRGGGGAVMGSKKLKAIAVRGRERVVAADPEGLAAVVKEQVAAIQGSPAFPGFSADGTHHTTDSTSTMGFFPTKNFQEGFLPNWHRIESDEYAKLRVRNIACHACMIHCTSLTKVNEGRYAGAWSEGPEYETIWGFTGATGSAEIGLPVAADRLCDNLGLDTISTASTIGFAYELFDRGLIDKEDMDGIELKYGDDEPVLSLIRKIAYREGFGDIMAEGTRGAAKRIGKGSERYAMQVKGLEIPGYDPRGAKAQGLSMLTSAAGGHHGTGYSNQEMFGVPWKGKKVDRFSVEDKGAMVKFNQDKTAVQNCGIMCAFGALFMPDFNIYGRLLASATGMNELSDSAHLWQVGERIINLERMFNVREGFGRKDDIMPERITNEPMPFGPSAGHVFEADVLLEDYYQARGWDVETGIPTAAKLNELGLGFAKSSAVQR